MAQPLLPDSLRGDGAFTMALRDLLAFPLDAFAQDGAGRRTSHITVLALADLDAATLTLHGVGPEAVEWLLLDDPDVLRVNGEYVSVGGTPGSEPPPAEAPTPAETLPAARRSVDVLSYADLPPLLIGGSEDLRRRIRYPDAARQANIEGTVYVRLVVTASGGVEEAVVVRSPSDLLSAEALRVVREVRFEPAVHRGRPVAVHFTIPVSFRLR